ncbi:metallophosphoesterase family protein [Paenibacillus rhizophilus]|uniref:DNA repair exonuclease n=1 Tax=Paenibacillus rhizophilus TaxID=1850366 RepID=A0A3N9P552_9BACL|nr:DNA repair exonuclease [Paenibacillus rhizophilus]RQW11341.1 DNA repair exonuclease [Paenibacillus rhizophilus]
MVPFRFVHAADLHLDSRFAGLSHIPVPIRDYLREAAFAALGRLVAVAVQEEADFVVISGDVYDSADSSLQSQLRFHEALLELSRNGIAIFLIHGNHDPLDGPRLHMELPDGVTVFGADTPGQVTVVRRSDGREVAVVSGLSYPTSKVTENTSLRYRRKEGSGLFHIALLHANVDGDPAHETYSPCTRRDLIDSGFDYWALGHIHKRRILHERPYIVYPGNIQGRSIKETGPKGCYVVDVDGSGIAGLRFRELDEVRFLIRDISIDGMVRETEWIEAVEQSVEEIRASHPELMSVVRFRIIGRGAVHRVLAEKGASGDLLDELRRREALRAEQGLFRGLVWTEGFSLESGTEVDRERLLAEDSFLGEMMRMAEESAEDGKALDELARAALAPLAENRELRRLLAEVGEDDMRAWLMRAAETAVTLLSDVMEPEEESHPFPESRNRQGGR